MINTAFPDLRGKKRAETVLPVPHGLMAEVDAALKQEILEVSQRQKVTDIKHHSVADYLGRTVEITEGVVYHWKLRALLPGSSWFSFATPF